MNPSRFDTLARSLTEVRTRRGALTALLGGALGLLGLTATAAKKKGSGKGKGKKNKNGGNPTGQPPPPPGPPPAPTCAETCSANCSLCISRAAGPPLCGDEFGGATSCAASPPCSSDNDCNGNPAEPYCIASGVERATGKLLYGCQDQKGRCSFVKEC